MKITYCSDERYNNKNSYVCLCAWTCSANKCPSSIGQPLLLCLSEERKQETRNNNTMVLKKRTSAPPLITSQRWQIGAAQCPLETLPRTVEKRSSHNGTQCLRERHQHFGLDACLLLLLLLVSREGHVVSIAD